jgi:hypothetical protein
MQANFPSKQIFQYNFFFQCKQFSQKTFLKKIIIDFNFFECV